MPKFEEPLIKRLLQACVSEQLLPCSLSENGLSICLTKAQKNIVAQDVQHFKLGKLKINGDIRLVSSNQSSNIAQVHELMNLIYAEIKDVTEPAQWEKFTAEIDNCNANANLTTQFMRKFNADLANRMLEAGTQTLFEYLSLSHSTAEQLMFFEAWASKGHPYHPCHKTKFGFTQDELRKYSPEFNPDISLPLAAIEKSMMEVKSELNNFDYSAWFAQQYPQAWGAWLQALRQHKLSETIYYPVFIHPWQYENTLTTLFKDAIAAKKIILFADAHITTKASLSFRTLMVKDNSTQPHIKLPVAVRSTSAMRTITPSSVHNGPQLSHIMKKIFTKELHLTKYIQLAYEICGLHVQHPDNEVAKHLGIIYRDNPARFVHEHQTALVVAALFEKSPINKIPLFIEILQTAVGTALPNAIDYFNQYSQTVIHAYLDLFLIYGIALEGHQQNTIAVFESSRLKFLIARDLGGLRVHAPTLKQHNFTFNAYPNSATVTNDRQEVTNKFLHTVIQYHLGELILLLAQYYQTSENVFWDLVKNNLAARFQALKTKVDPERWQQEYHAIFKEDWKMKCFMHMRLQNMYSQYIYTNLKNPMGH